MIAALYVQSKGCYVGLEGVDPWDVERDARKYAGPWPVVAHPPCKRWSRYWYGGPSAKVRLKMGDDGGCFEAALASVRRWGGVLEHPEASHAWWAYGLNKPPRYGGWIAADFHGGWACCVEQGHYGHKARKPTWLYAVGVELSTLIWGPSDAKMDIPEGATPEERQRLLRQGIMAHLSRFDRMASPPAFRDLLLAMARTVDIEADSCTMKNGRKHGTQPTEHRPARRANETG